MRGGSIRRGPHHARFFDIEPPLRPTWSQATQDGGEHTWLTWDMGTLTGMVAPDGQDITGYLLVWVVTVKVPGYKDTCLIASEHVVKLEAEMCIVRLRGTTEDSPRSQECCYRFTYKWRPRRERPSDDCPDGYSPRCGREKGQSGSPL